MAAEIWNTNLLRPHVVVEVDRELEFLPKEPDSVTVADRHLGAGREVRPRIKRVAVDIPEADHSPVDKGPTVVPP